MECSTCGSTNRPGRRFCAECGALLSVACRKCGFVNEPGEKFCGGCSAPLGTADPAPKATAASAGAERRQVTVLFSDLVGSTALASRLDPEDARDVIREYERHCAGIVARYGGVVGQLLGDGVLAYFGYPVAHEDDSGRAIHAALEIATSTPTLKLAGGERLATRVGIATGLVVIGELIATEVSHQHAISGEAPNLAARLQALAQPNEVLVSPATRRLAAGAFLYRELGPREIKGLAAPVHVWQVIGRSEAETRFEAADGGRGASLVGRDHELGLLRDRWALCNEGEGQVVLLSGEAGIGKSRLVQALDEALNGTPVHKVRYQCLAYFANSPLYPVTRQVERSAGITRAMNDAERLEQLQQLLRAEGSEESLPLFVALLGIAPPPGLRPSDLPAARLKQQTQSALLEQLRRRAATTPLLLVVEDAHWIDPTTLELLDLLVGAFSGLKVMMVVTFRPEFKPSWLGYSHVTHLALNRLSRRQCSEIVSNITMGKALPQELQQQLIARTDGIPLFVEEHTRMVLESGLLREEGSSYVLTRQLPELAIPASLQDALMARLDRVPGTKELAQLCAVVGRDVPYELIAALAGADDVSLQARMEALVAAGLFLKSTGESKTVYSFKHALIQDAAYNSMLRAARQGAHSTVARVLQEQFPERVGNQPEILAFHLTEAGETGEAVAQWRLAGQKAVSRGAMREAIAHYRSALDCLSRREPGAQRDALELESLIAIGVPLIAARGYTDPQVHETYTRARQLARELGDDAQLFTAMWGLWTCHRARLEMHEARELAAELNELARHLDDPSRLLAAHHAQWTTYTYLGDLIKAGAHCEQGAGLYRPEQHHRHVFIYGGHDPGCCGVATAALGLCLTGRIGEALERMEAARELAGRLGHPPTTAHALTYSALLAHFLRDSQGALQHASRTLEIAEKIEQPGYVAAAKMVGAWARSAQGMGTGSVTEITACTRTNLFMVAGVTRPYFLAMLAEVQVDIADYAAALETIDSALDEIEKHQMRFWEPELHRMRGDVLERLHEPARLQEACYRRAIEAAEGQSATLLALRARTSLARIAGARGDASPAHDELAQLLGGFEQQPAVSDVLEARRALALR
ncbi:MAG: AAA family ATPase [Burkholderiales bacterium]|nr:AAA family ATPase [Burkholderiales bacterium]